VASLNRPGGNVTGFTEINTEVWSKRFELLRQLVPRATRFGALVNPTNQTTKFILREAVAAAGPLGLQIAVSSASTAEEIVSAFTSMRRDGIEALVVAPDSFFYAQSVQVIELAMRYGLPAAFWDRGWAVAGGLMSYGSDVLDFPAQGSAPCPRPTPSYRRATTTVTA
jgi:putative tryptophan/tyrosine transport system substrate-binding protein